MVWREILKIVVDAILFCAKNNIALRGSNEKIGDPSCGIFLNLIEFASHYNRTLKERIEKHKKGFVSYFSPIIQNEIIKLIGDKTRNEIISRIKKSKYYTILFDCTPDISKKEQMIKERTKIEESFIDFIHSHEKTGEGLTTEILNKLEGDKLDINDARGQGCDNGANMAGKYKGVRARILEINSLAIFIPCAAHNLNLAGVHAGSTLPEMITFFGTVQRLFNFFSSSTIRWEILMKSLKLTLKSFSDTRWSSKANAITSLSLHLSEVKKGLESISNDLSNPEAVSNAKSLLLLINYRFICTLSMWNKILQCIDRTNKALQRKDILIDHAAKLIDALRCTLQGLREVDLEQNFQEAKNLAETMNLQAGFPDKRKKKVKKMANYEATDEGSNMTPEHLFKMQIYKIFNTLLS
ncbi:uncharacterized protein LOC136078494 [Hydra vulgaris]|uniref:Uncharacterized protein LOC136078494 n=1 Tax=Hydra vulgaris TaxID=6087 RepID=A0ABM4BMP8_HYDVU